VFTLGDRSSKRVFDVVAFFGKGGGRLSAERKRHYRRQLEDEGNGYVTQIFSSAWDNIEGRRLIAHGRTYS
jgi:hypothetical protein